jgi:hypothetical protein
MHKMYIQEITPKNSRCSTTNLDVWCLTPLSTIILQLHGDGKTTDLPQVTDKLYHIMLHRVHLEITTFGGIGTGCTGSCKSSYHTITTKTTP